MPVFNPADGLVLTAFAVICIQLLWPKPQRKIQEPWWAPEEDE